MRLKYVRMIFVAWLRSGNAAVCKTANGGSIPPQASFLRLDKIAFYAIIRDNPAKVVGFFYGSARQNPFAQKHSFFDKRRSGFKTDNGADFETA